MPSKRKNGKAKRNRTTNSATAIHSEQVSLQTVFVVSSKAVVPRNVQLEIGQRVQWTYEEAEGRHQSMSPRIKCEGLFESNRLTPSKPSFAYTFRSRGSYEVVISSQPNVLQSIKVVPTEGECYTESDSFADSDDDFSDDDFPYVTADNPTNDHVGLERPFDAAVGNFIANESPSTETTANAIGEIESQNSSGHVPNIAVTKGQRKSISQDSTRRSVNSREDDETGAKLVTLNTVQDSDLRSDNEDVEKHQEVLTQDLLDLSKKTHVHPSKGLGAKSRCPHNQLVEGKNKKKNLPRFAQEQLALNCTGDSTSMPLQTDVSQGEDTFTSEKESFVPGVCGVEESKLSNVASFAHGSSGSEDECVRDDRSAKTAPVESPQDTIKDYPCPPSKSHKVVNDSCKRTSAKAVRRKQKRQTSDVKPREISESVHMGNGKHLEVPRTDALANGNIKEKQWPAEKKSESDTPIVKTEKWQKVDSATKKHENNLSTSRRVEAHSLSTSPSRIESPKLTGRKECDRRSLPHSEDTRLGKQGSKKSLSRKQSKGSLKKQRTPLKENVTDQANELSTKPSSSSSAERHVTQQESQAASETLRTKDNLKDASKPRAVDSSNKAALSSVAHDETLRNGKHVLSPPTNDEENDCFNEATAEQMLLQRWRKIERLIELGHLEGMLNF